MEHGSFRGRATFVCFLLFIWVGATVLTARARSETTAAAPDWVFECAACPHNFYDLGPRSAQIDAAGIAHVVYGGEALYHAWQSEDGWQVEVVEDRLGVGSQAALVIDGNGTFHIFYLDEGAQSLRYAHGTTAAWTLETVATDVGDEPWPSPAVMATGQLHVAFRDGAENAIIDAWNDSTGWQFSTVDTGGGYHPSLALDRDDRPHVSYVMAAPGELRYAYDDGSWHVETVHEDVRALQSALALDASGQPNLVYSGPDMTAESHFDAILMYAFRDTASWHHEVADASYLGSLETHAIGSDVSMSLDTTGRPHAAYTSSHHSATPYPSMGYSLPRYATRTTDGWSVTLLSDHEHTERTALALDGAGQPHVVYQQVGDLLYSFYTGSWEREVVALGGVAGVGASMALDARGRAHISSLSNSVYSSLFDYDRLLYTRRTAEGWYSEPSGGSTTPNTALAVAPDGYPHLLLNTYGRFTGDFTLYYRYQDVSGWHNHLVGDYPGVTGMFYDLAIAGDGQVHAVWSSAGELRPAGHLYYTRLPTPEPFAPELLSDAEVRHVSLTTDAGGNPHVAYSAGGALRYAFRDGAGWHEEIVTSSGFGVDQVALALDGDGQPHFAFYAAYSRDLYYLSPSLIDSSRAVGPVDAAGDVGQYPAIAVTGDGRPHISYYDATNQDLKYAHYDDDGWTWAIETLASEGNVGLYTSIDLYVYPHISYYDATRGDLRYVYKPFIPVAFSHLPLVAR